ncbi:MAG: hypothetical protein KC413_15370 [Anaerolineales bacterium]|nr:hypothetical protein [Anaerolineales bacterium]
MITIEIPGYKRLQLNHLVLDYNGTLAVDGLLLPHVATTLNTLAEQVQVHVLTADTFGTARAALADVRCELGVLPLQAQDVAKRDYVLALGAAACVAVGNGRNDALMLQAAALGIAVLQAEGTAVVTLTAADVVTPTILDALALLTEPRRLIATLRA